MTVIRSQRPSRSLRCSRFWPSSRLSSRSCSKHVCSRSKAVKISATDVSKRFGAFAALDRVNLEVRSGELLALLGPSGSGKTTLLRIIAGLDWPDSGAVSFDGEDALARGASERHVGFVFQHYALFRHMTVFENVAFGLRVQPRAIRKDEPSIRARVKELRHWLRSLHHEISVTSIFVTHDQEEALEVANRVVVMDKGRIEQIGSPGEGYDEPATAFVHGFIGESIVLQVDVSDGYVRFGGKALNIAAGGVASGAS